MSLILDALRPRSPDRDASGAPKTARADAVLAALGYSGRYGRSAPPLKTLVLYGAGAILLGFVGVALLVTVLAPPPLPNQSTLAQRSAASPAPAPAAPRAIETPQLPQASAPAPAPRATAPDVQPAGAPAAPVREAAQPTPSAVARNATPERVDAPSAAPPVPIRAQPIVPPPPAVSSDPPPIPAQLSAAPASPGPAPPVNSFGLALFHQRFGDYAAARSLYSAVVTKNGPNSVVHNNEGVMFIDRGEPEGAILELKEALTLDPKYVKAQNNLGVAFLNAGRLEEATKALHVALAQEPRNVESIVNLALVHKAAGRPTDARDLLQRAVVVEPRSAGAHYNLAVVADEGGDAAVAAEHYRAFLRLDSGQYPNLIARVRARLSALGR